MNTIMEEKEKTSQYLYEDERVFLTENEELFLKNGSQGEQQKMGDVSADKVEGKLAELRDAFAGLETKVQETLSSDDLTQAMLNNLSDEINQAKAVGDLKELLEQVETKKAALGDENDDQNEDAAHDSTEKAELADDESAVSEPAAEEDAESEDEDQPEAGEVSPEEENEQEAEVSDDPETYYRDIVKKAEELSAQNDWAHVESELDKLSHQWSDGPASDSDKVKKLFQKFNKAVSSFEKRKEEHYEEVNRKKEKNLETKKRLLEEFEGIISNETWSATKRVSQLKGQWNHVGSLPAGKGEKLDERFEELVGIFNDHKVDRLVQQRQKEEDNLMLKLAVLEKMESIVLSMDHTTDNWKEIDEKFESLTGQWKKIGRVPKEKANHVWERYKNAQDEYYDRKYKYDKQHQSKVDKFSSKKEKICEEAEALLDEKDLASAARKINKLHRRWKKTGNLPQLLEDRLWNRFKAATDAFNERKANNQDKIKEQEDEHYRQKLALIDEANAIKDTDDFEKGHSQMQSLMDRWKKVGPVSRKKSNKIWKKFKGAMDVFYDRRRDHFKEVKEKRKDNLNEKQEILDKLRELGQHEDPIEAVNIAKGLQEKFKDAGYVPIKQKNKMWKQYREVCDVIYNRFRAAKSGDKFDRELAKADLGKGDRNKIQQLRKQFKKVEKEVRNLEKEVLQYKETKTYFKPSNSGNSLLDEVEEKIEKAEQKLEQKQKKLDSLSDEMEGIREDATE
ncbi:MAG TPA: DUF349 domain-containing protein [Balneolaceae bacterium]|nr:DUF349 domain-containing protein [Balneolaceae bacterium]